jgi:hypothetical protein
LEYEEVVIDEVTYYHVKVELAAGNALEDIKVAVTLNAGENTVTSTWTVNVFNYTKSVINGNFDETTKTLMKDMLAYASAAHTYFKNTMFTKRLVISYSIGEGYAHKFLNGITIYAWDGEQTKVIAQKNFTETNPYVFTEEKAKREAVELLKDYLLKQAEENGVSLGEASASQLSTQLVEEAFE